MSKEVYSYRFNRDCPAREVEETLHLAVIAVESLHGQSRVRLDASYCMDSEQCGCVIDASTEVGRHIVRIFTGFAIREFGEEAFKVSRVGSEAAHARCIPSPSKSVSLT